MWSAADWCVPVCAGSRVRNDTDTRTASETSVSKKPLSLVVWETWSGLAGACVCVDSLACTRQKVLVQTGDRPSRDFLAPLSHSPTPLHQHHPHRSPFIYLCKYGRAETPPRTVTKAQGKKKSIGTSWNVLRQQGEAGGR